MIPLFFLSYYFMAINLNRKDWINAVGYAILGLMFLFFNYERHYHTPTEEVAGTDGQG